MTLNLYFARRSILSPSPTSSKDLLANCRLTRGQSLRLSRVLVRLIPSPNSFVSYTLLVYNIKIYIFVNVVMTVSVVIDS